MTPQCRLHAPAVVILRRGCSRLMTSSSSSSSSDTGLAVAVRPQHSILQATTNCAAGVLSYGSKQQPISRAASPLLMFGDNSNIMRCLNNNHRRALFTTTTTPSSSSDDDDDNDDDYSFLLTRATAKQMKGDVPEAIKLTSRALSIMMMISKQQQKHSNDDDDDDVVDEIADTKVFLGKLYQLENRYEEAATSFEEARLIFFQQQQKEEDVNTININVNTNNAAKKKEYTALSHLAHAQNKLGFYDTSESNYLHVLSGFERIVGWKDGRTNHTCFELSQLYRQHHHYDKALATLETMKEKLTEAFGGNTRDPKVLQLNGEMAELLQLQLTSSNNNNNNNDDNDDSKNDKEKDKDDDENNSSSGNTNTISNITIAAEEKAVALLEEALDSLPPNSPEARAIFVRLEDLKEQIEEKEEERSAGRRRRGSILHDGNDNDNDSGSESTRLNGVTVTVTKNTVKT